MPLDDRVDPTVHQVRHIDHANPAAQGDIFCDGEHFAMVNAALASLDSDEIDWLPSKGWNELAAETGGTGGDVAERMGAFIASTMELHQLYLDRLAGVKDEGLELPAITGVFDTGTQLKVTDVRTERGGLCTVRLTELPEQTLVS